MKLYEQKDRKARGFIVEEEGLKTLVQTLCRTDTGNDVK